MFERSRTDVAHVRSLFGMNPPMHAEILLNTEAFVAELAFEGLLARMGPVVASQPRGNRECFRADIAPVRIVRFFVVRVLMCLVSRFGRENFIAQRTLDVLRFEFYIRRGELRQWEVRAADDSLNGILGGLDGGSIHGHRVCPVETHHLRHFLIQQIFCKKKIKKLEKSP